MSTTPSDTPVGVIVNVSAQIAQRFFDEADQWQAKADTAAANNDPAASSYAHNALMARATAQSILDAEGLPADSEAVQIAPLTADELAQQTTDQQAAAAAAAAKSAEIASTNEDVILRQRNRWLFETDPYNLASGAIDDLPADVQTTVQQNLAAIKTWRQQLRDYPDTVSDWTQPPALPAPPAINLPSGKPLFRLT